MIWISMSFAWTPARSRSRSPHIALNVFCWSLLVAIVLIVLLLVLSARLPSRLSPSCRPVSLLACRSAPRSVFSCLPVSRVDETGRWAGRAWSRSVSRVGGRGAVGVRVCSLVSWSVYLFHCISFRERFPMSGGRFQGVLGCLLDVRSRLISCVSVRSCSSRFRLSPLARLVLR